jgi:adenylate cyclase
MSFEIEKKFIVPELSIELLKTANQVKVIKQAYIGEGEHFVTRVRLSEVYDSYGDYMAGVCAKQEAFITIKEKTSGAKRLEVEPSISIADALLLINKESKKIEKVRYCFYQKESYSEEFIPSKLVPKDFFKNVNAEGIVEKTLMWELDVFEGTNKGLSVCEIELDFEDQPFSIPSWVGQDVTEEQKYYNFELLNTPYTTW